MATIPYGKMEPGFLLEFLSISYLLSVSCIICVYPNLLEYLKYLNSMNFVFKFLYGVFSPQHSTYPVACNYGLPSIQYFGFIIYRTLLRMYYTENAHEVPCANIRHKKPTLARQEQSNELQPELAILCSLNKESAIHKEEELGIFMFINSFVTRAL